MAHDYYQGKYTPVNPLKYEGDVHRIIYRSLWERMVFKWCDQNPDVVMWSSEETVVPYRCKTDGAVHRYFIDLKITFKNGRTALVEIKPERQTQEPKPAKRRSKTAIMEALNYAKNRSKWDAAEEYAKNRGWIFEIWTEKTLRNMGIKIL